MIRKLLIGVLLIAAVIAAAGGYFKHQYPSVTRVMLGEPHAVDENLTKVLVTQDMVMLGRVDFQLLEEIDQSASTQWRHAIEKIDLFTARLLTQHALPHAQQNHALVVASYADKVTHPSTLSILEGVFDVAAVLQSLRGQHNLFTRYLNDNEVEIYDVKPLDTMACDEGEVSLYITPTRIMVAPALLMDRMLPLILAGKHGGRSLQEWTMFSRYKVASFWFDRPKHAPLGASPYMQHVDAYFSAYRNIFVGAGFDLFSGKGEFDWQAEMQTQKHASFTRSKWKAYVAQNKAALDVKAPLMRPYLPTMVMRHEGKVLDMEFEFEKDFLAKIPFAFQEIADNVLSEVSHSVRHANTAEHNGKLLLAEKIDATPRKYFANMSYENLPVYEANHFGKSDLVNGPFGMKFERAYFNEQTKRVELDLSVLADVPNIGDRAARVRLNALDVLDAQGKSLLHSKACLMPWLEKQATIFLNKKEGGVGFEKIASLQDGVQLKDIDRIDGSIILNLPKTVKRKRLPLAENYPFHIEINQETKLSILSVVSSRIEYVISGNVTDVLELRGLNENNDILAAAFKEQTLHYSTQGKREQVFGSTVFHGEPTSLEVVVADDEVQAKYSFSLKQENIKSTGRQKVVKLTPLDWAGDTLSTLPDSTCPTNMEALGFFCMRQIASPQSDNGPLAGIKVMVADTPYLRHAVARLGMQINKIGRRSVGWTQWPVFQPDEKKGYLSAQFLFPEQKMPARGVVSGRLWFNEPRTTQTHTFESLSLGSSMMLRGVALSLVEDNGRGGYVLEAIQGGERVVSLQGKDAAGRLLKTNVTDIEETDGAFRFHFTSHGAQSLDVVVAQNQRQERYRFSVSH